LGGDVLRFLHLGARGTEVRGGFFHGFFVQFGGKGWWFFPAADPIPG
jgi:hypothetical protein